MMNLHTKAFKLGSLEVEYAPRFDTITIPDVAVSKAEPRDYFDCGFIDVLGVTIKDKTPVFADIFDANSLSDKDKDALKQQIASFFKIDQNDASKILEIGN